MTMSALPPGPATTSVSPGFALKPIFSHQTVSSSKPERGGPGSFESTPAECIGLIWSRVGNFGP